MLRHTDGNTRTDREVEYLHPEPVLFRCIKDFIIQYCEYLSEAQVLGIFLVLGDVIDVYAQAKKCRNETHVG
jgi:hypothetical protein